MAGFQFGTDGAGGGPFLQGHAGAGQQAQGGRSGRVAGPAAPEVVQDAGGLRPAFQGHQGLRARQLEFRLEGRGPGGRRMGVDQAEGLGRARLGQAHARQPEGAFGLPAAVGRPVHQFLQAAAGQVMQAVFERGAPRGQQAARFVHRHRTGRRLRRRGRLGEGHAGGESRQDQRLSDDSVPFHFFFLAVFRRAGFFAAAGTPSTGRR